MESIEMEGKTVDEAVELAVAQMGVTREDVEVEILEEPVKGGLFKKSTPAKVKITKKLSDAQRAVEFLDGLFDLTGVKAVTEIVRDDEKICINLTASNSSFLIGYRGEVLDSLQCLAGAVANIGRDEYKRVVVDCEDYRAKREETLTSLALRLAEKAVRTGRKINLEPMNPFERRIIHTALVDHEQVKTESEGKEPNRYIVIVPNELKDERPIFADRSRNDSKDHGRGGHGGKRFDGRRSSSRNDRRGGGRGFSRDRKPREQERTMYGKPKDKNNITSFGTFIGNSHND